MEISKIQASNLKMANTYEVNIKDLQGGIEKLKSDNNVLSDIVESNNKANEETHGVIFKTIASDYQVLNDKLTDMNSKINLLTGNLGETRAKVILLESTLEEVITEMATNIKINQIIIATLVVIIIIQLVVIFKMVYR